MAAVLASLPDACRATRQVRRLSHRTAAEQIGMAYADLCRFEQGQKDIRLSTAIKIVKWMAET